jgi:hypothetical protein
MDRDTLKNMPMEQLAEVHMLVNTIYNERQASYKQELIRNLCKAYNALRCAYPDLGYFPINPNISLNCAISAPQNVFEKIGYTMNPDWFNNVAKMEVMG